MPIKWTPEKDQLLLLKILESHKLKVNTDKVAQAWPADQEKPTPCAIAKRLVRMHKMVKSSSDNSSGGHFSIDSGTTSVASSPGKPGKTSSVFSILSSKKRKKYAFGSPLQTEMDVKEDQAQDEKQDSDGGDVVADIPIPDFSAASSSSALRIDYGQSEAEDQVGSSLGLNKADQMLGDGSPVKPNGIRARRATVQRGMVDYENLLGDDDDISSGLGDDMDSSASDYVPDGAGVDDDDFA